MTVPLSRELPIETTRRGYWLGIALGVASIGILALFFWRFYNQVQAMPRVDARGTHTVNLPAGDLVIFGELPDWNAAGSLRCAATDSAGTALTLENVGSTSITYDVGSHSGRNLFNMNVPKAGPVTITCETDADVVLAFGDGMGGRSILITMLLSAAAGLSGCVVFFRTLFRRHNEKKAARKAAAASADRA